MGRYDGEYPGRSEEEIFQYLSLPGKEFPEANSMLEQLFMDQDYFMSMADTFRPPHLWKREKGAWKLRRTVWEEELKSKFHGQTECPTPPTCGWTPDWTSRGGNLIKIGPARFFLQIVARNKNPRWNQSL